MDGLFEKQCLKTHLAAYLRQSVGPGTATGRAQTVLKAGGNEKADVEASRSRRAGLLIK